MQSEHVLYMVHSKHMTIKRSAHSLNTNGELFAIDIDMRRARERERLGENVRKFGTLCHGEVASESRAPAQAFRTLPQYLVRVFLRNIPPA